jgi:hypothetical protein
MGGLCSSHGQTRNAYTVLAGNMKRTVHLDRFSRKLEDNI